MQNTGYEDNEIEGFYMRFMAAIRISLGSWVVTWMEVTNICFASLAAICSSFRVRFRFRFHFATPKPMNTLLVMNP